jgi:phosphoribosylformylglycinamidine synthase II/phosphoribosylformylglycinamidine synthase I
LRYPASRRVVTPRTWIEARPSGFSKLDGRAFITNGARGIVQGTVERALSTNSLLVEIQTRDAFRTSVSRTRLPHDLHVVERSRLLYAHKMVGDTDLAPFNVLADPIREIVRSAAGASGPYLDVFCQPGVTDAEGDMSGHVLALSGYLHVSCRAGTRYRFNAAVPLSDRSAVEDALGNPIIHTFTWSDNSDMADELVDEPSTDRVESIDLDVGDQELVTMSTDLGLALDLTEMRAVRDHFRGLGRSPTDVEIQSIALAWSEHCSHKTFKARIHHTSSVGTESISGLLSEFIAGPSLALNKPWLRSAFEDNAGIIGFDDEYDIAVKVETHNHPSALEPYGGAHTGVGGVIRDILAVSAEPIANTDVICFGAIDADYAFIPSGVRHPRDTFRGVVQGVADYGNNMGIPTVGGSVLFDPGYTANPLVFCGTVGILPTGSHPTNPQPGDTIVVLGGRTGRDGLNGATMSSAGLGSGGKGRSAVQIGAPITEKVLRDVIPLLRDEHLYNAITDCGAGGLCSAVGEMGSKLGFDCELDRVPLKYDGLAPWEIWLSEAQERMVLAVPAEHLDRVSWICERFDLEMSVIGEFCNHHAMRLFYDGRVVSDLSLEFVHSGCPVRELHSVAPARQSQSSRVTHPARNVDHSRFAEWLLALLAHPNIASKESVVRRYDFEVGGGTVVKPFNQSAGPSDGTVVKPLPESWRGVVIGHGINPRGGETDPRAMALRSVDEALRNLVASGGSLDHVALLDNFCWGEVDSPDTLGTLVEATVGCRDAIERYGAPFVSGKDSLRNSSKEVNGVTSSIPGTLLVTAVGVVDDIRRCVTTDLKSPSSRLYLLGKTGSEMAGAHLNDVIGDTAVGLDRAIPTVADETPALMRALSRAIQHDLVRSCHDLSEGGLGVSAAEMAIGGKIGLEVDIALMTSRSTDLSAVAALFAETPGRFLCEVPPESAAAFEANFAGLPYVDIGKTTAKAHLRIHSATVGLIDLPLERAERAWRTAIDAAAPAEIPATIALTSGSLGPPTPSCAAVAHRNKPRVLILQAAGINCDRETFDACQMAGADVELAHVNRLLSREVRIADYAGLVLPGGFSYGDHIGGGVVLAATLRAHLLTEIKEFADSGRPIVGICNGFQIIAHLGLLGPVSLAQNAHERFECRWVALCVHPSDCRFLDGLECFDLPIAHGEGRVIVTPGAEQEVLSRAPLRYAQNPNGSVADIAAVCSPAGNVFGLMPHPERFTSVYQHPAGARFSGPVAGLVLFGNIVRVAAWV